MRARGDTIKREGRTNVKKLLCALCAAALAAAAFAPGALAESAPPETFCEAYIVVDADTGQVLLEKNADEVLYPA